MNFLYVTSFYHTMSEEYVLHSIEILVDQCLQLILQCYFNGHTVAPLVVASAFLITFLASCHLLGRCPLTV